MAQVGGWIQALEGGSVLYPRPSLSLQTKAGAGGGKPLPVKSTPGAVRDVDFGGGSQATKNARRESVSRRRQQSESPLAGQAKTNVGRTFQRPTEEEGTKFHFALLTPLGDSMFSRLASPHEPNRGLYTV